MATISIIRVENPEKKAEISAHILHALPDWFGLPDSTQKYIDDSRNMPFFAAVREGQAVGFAALKETSPCAGEIYVMGVLPEYHRSGIGRQQSFVFRQDCHRFPETDLHRSHSRSRPDRPSCRHAADEPYSAYHR